MGVIITEETMFMCDYGDDKVANYQIKFQGSPEALEISLCRFHFNQLVEAIYKEMKKNI